MDDDFHNPLPTFPSSTWENIWNSIWPPHPNIILAMFLGPILVLFITRYLSGRAVATDVRENERTVWKFPYWIPVVGHGFDFFMDPGKLFREARDQSPHGIFSLNMGGKTHNIISDPTLIQSVMVQKENAVQYFPVAWEVIIKFFGTPKSSKRKYDKVWDEMRATSSYLIKDPHMSIMLRKTVQHLEQSIPQMVTFMVTDIDLQPWEKYARATFISKSETEVDFMALMRDMMGNASVPSMFGREFMEKYPDVVHNILQMDKGMQYFMMGLPAWLPWPPIVQAHIARSQVWTALDDQQKVLDAMVDGKEVDYNWGEMEDVSDFILRRHLIYKNNDFEVRERGEMSILWSLVINPTLVVYWHLLYILSTPGLLSRLRTEISPYITIHKPLTIGKFSEAPKLTISENSIAKNCPLLKSTYFETLRLTDQPWSVRKLAEDVVIGGDDHGKGEGGYLCKKGEFVTMPHDIHMKDPTYYQNPEKFEPERFIVRGEDGDLDADIGTIKPYGGGLSICQGRILAERECLAFVAGIVAFWDIEPVDKKMGWAVPTQIKTTAVSRPKQDMRVRVKKRVFVWDEEVGALE